MPIYSLENNARDAAVSADPNIFICGENALLPPDHAFRFPSFADHELYAQCELVIRVSRSGSRIEADSALDYVDGITTGLSFTSLDINKVLNGLDISWHEARDWPGSRVVSALFSPLPAHLDDIHFCVYQNREPAQMAHASALQWGVCEAVARVSESHELFAGDLIFCGSPVGFFPVEEGDTLETFLEDDSALELTVSGE